MLYYNLLISLKKVLFSTVCLMTSEHFWFKIKEEVKEKKTTTLELWKFKTKDDNDKK